MAAFKILQTLEVQEPVWRCVPDNLVSPRIALMSDGNSLVIAAHRIFDGDEMRGSGAIQISRGRIEGISLGPPEQAAIRLSDDIILAPGLIDVQVNGGGGVLLNDEPTVAGVERIVAAHRKSGTTGCLPTLITDRTEVIERLAAAAQACLNIPGVLGFHLEGPALNRSRKGIHPEHHIRLPNDRDIAAIRSFGSHGRSLVTLAPECVPEPMIEDLISAGLRIAAGHSEVTSAGMGRAAELGVSGVTHLFNAMSQLSAREPGLVGATLEDDRLFAGIICDGIHVDPVSLHIAVRCKGPERLMLVTDAMPLVGTHERQFMLHRTQITLHEDRLTGPDGTLAGAHLTMIEAVRNAVTLLGLSLADALIMASRTPATFLGLDGELGRIAPGYRADLVAFNRNFEVVGTWVNGTGSER